MINYLLEVLASSFVFWLIYRAFLQKDTFFERNRIYLLTATLLSLLLPLANWQVMWASNEITQGLPVAGSVLLQEIQVGTTSIMSLEEKSWIIFLPYLAVVVSSIYLAYWFIGVARLFLIAKENPKQNFKDYTLVNVEKNQYPFSFLNYLFWGKELVVSEPERQKIIQHELAHIKGKHSYDIILMELVCTVFWLNPFFFLFKKYLKEQHEYIADASVYMQGEKSNYARLMVQNTLKSLDLGSGFLPNTSLQLSHNFYQSPIIKRLEMMNKQRTPIVKNVKLFVILPAIALLGFMYSCNNVEDTEAVVEDIEKKAELDKIFSEVDQTAAPDGGMQAFFTHVAETVEYPTEAKKAGLEGKVFVEFVVEKNGTVSDAKVLKGFDEACDKEALKAITSAPKWHPAVKDGKNVRQKMVIPIAFKLD